MFAMLATMAALMTASAKPVDGLSLLQRSCHASRGDPAVLAEIADRAGWSQLTAEETELLRDGNVPDAQYGYELEGGAKLFLAVHPFGPICQVTFDSNAVVVKTAVESWELGGAKLGAPNYFQENVSNRLAIGWSNYAWAVNRSGVASVNLSYDPMGSSVTLEMSYL